MIETNVAVPQFKVICDRKTRLNASKVKIPVVFEKELIKRRHSVGGTVDASVLMRVALPTLPQDDEVPQSGDTVNLSKTAIAAKVSSDTVADVGRETHKETATGAIHSGALPNDRGSVDPLQPIDTKRPSKPIRVNAEESSQTSTTLKAGRTLFFDDNGTIAISRGKNVGNKKVSRKSATIKQKGNAIVHPNVWKLYERKTRTAATNQKKMKDRITKTQEENAKLKRDNLLLIQRNGQYHQGLTLANSRLNELRESDEDPSTVAEKDEVIEKLQGMYQLLEESKKDQVMAIIRDFEEYKQGQDKRNEDVQEKLVETQEALYNTRKSLEGSKEEHADCLVRLGSSHSDQQIIAAFQRREATLKLEKKLMLQSNEELKNKREEDKKLVSSLRSDQRQARRDLEEANDRNTRLTSANVLLEARATPIDFLGLPPQQRQEMAQMEAQLADITEQFRITKETLHRFVNADPDYRLEILQDSHNHRCRTLTLKCNSLIQENDELKQDKQILQYYQEHNEAMSVRFQVDHEDLKIAYYAVSNDLKALREQLANGDCTLMDPRSWLHMKECSEGREQAILREKRAEEELARVTQAIGAWEQFYQRCQGFVERLWMRVWQFEELCHPLQCPAYLLDDRGELVSLTLRLFEMDINNIDEQMDAQLQAEDLRDYGQYRGIHHSPEAWSSLAQKQKDGSNSAGASVGSWATSASAKISVKGGSISKAADENDAKDISAGHQSVTGERPMSANLEQYVKDPGSLIRNLSILNICLWARVWEFEDIVKPNECEKRVWDNRKKLVDQTYQYAGFEVNKIDPDEEAKVFVAHGPLHTPDAWMPKASSLDGKGEHNSDNDFDDGHGGHSVGDGQAGHHQDYYGGSNDGDGANDAAEPDAGEGADVTPDEAFESAGSGDSYESASNNVSYHGDNGTSSSGPDFSKHTGTYHVGTFDKPLTVASSSSTSVEELDVIAETMADNHHDVQQVINDRLLAKRLAAHPELFGIEEPASSQPWMPLTGNNTYIPIDKSMKKNKGLDPELYTKAQIAAASPQDADKYVPTFGLSQEQLDASIAECQLRLNQSMGYSSISDRTFAETGASGSSRTRDVEVCAHGKTVRWADDIAAGFANLDVDLEQVRYFGKSDLIDRGDIEVADREE